MRAAAPPRGPRAGRAPESPAPTPHRPRRGPSAGKPAPPRRLRVFAAVFRAQASGRGGRHEEGPVRMDPALRTGRPKPWGPQQTGRPSGAESGSKPFGLAPTRPPAPDGAGEARPSPMAGKGGAGVRPLPQGEATPTSERGNTPASGWVGRGLRARPSRPSSARLSIHPSVHPSIPSSRLRAAAAGAGRGEAGGGLSPARQAAPCSRLGLGFPDRSARGRGAGTGRCQDHDAPPGPRSVGLQSWPFLCVTPPTVCVSCCPGSGGRPHRATAGNGVGRPFRGALAVSGLGALRGRRAPLLPRWVGVGAG